VRWASGRLSMAVGVAVVTTLSAAAGVLARGSGGDGVTDGYVAAAQTSGQAPVPVAALKRRITPHLLIVAPSPIPAEAVDRVRKAKGVAAAEVVDAASALVAGKRVGLLGVDPSTFRSFTPARSAESDPLWRNVAAGDVAVSFTLGQDGGVKLGAVVPAGGSRAPGNVRVGAYATMGIGPVDAVVSRAKARQLGLPTGNALILSTSAKDQAGLAKRLTKALPAEAKVVALSQGIEPPGPSGAPGDGGVAPARGAAMTSRQVMVAIRAAQTKLGMLYVWGGESDAEGGYDCSGIIQWSFARAGVRMPRVAADQARTGPRIPYSQARPGDLLIWTHDPTAPNYVSHIAVYLGGGKMLVAPRTGDVVKISDVYFRNFRGAVRVNPRLAASLA
jgi:cell wall-associated NlpC family hydrolase